MSRTTAPPPLIAVRAPVDPRIRRRRAEVRRAEGRRRLRVVVAAAILSAAVAGGWGALRSPLLDVDRIEVVGVQHLEPAEVASAAAIPRGTALVDVDPGAVAERVRALGWVGTVRVERSWPSTVAVVVTERTPVAVTRHDGEPWLLLDAGGRVLEQAAERPSGLVVMEGVSVAGARPGATVEGAEAALAVARLLPAPLRAEVEAVVRTDGGTDLRLRGGGVAYLGSAQRLAEKLRALQTVLARVDTTGLATLDLRQPASPALTRHQPSSRVSTLSTG